MKYMKYDMFSTISSPTLILSTKYHKHLGQINNTGRAIQNSFNMASHQEISFDVYKNVDGVECDLWDQIVDLKYVYVPEQDIYYEIAVSLKDADSTVKHITGVSAGERELSQRYLRDFHVNDETDILMEDYVVTVFYDPLNPKGSLLDRVLHDKAPDWSIWHVDNTIAPIQRTFSANDKTIYDFLTKDVADEIGCLFIFDSSLRQISAYDLKNKCNDCGFRGEFINKCPKCGSTDFTKGFGKFQNVFISTENVANQLTVDGDIDQVKNCFRVEGGDDLITATVANLNPNRSNYIYQFSDDMRADMPTELVQKLDEYYELYNQKLADYEQYTDDYYEAVDQELYYQTTMMPDTPIPGDTTAEEQLEILMNEDFSVSVQNLSSISLASADIAVKGYAKVLIDPRYTVDVSDSSLIGNTWAGKFTVESLGKVNEYGEKEKATSETAKLVSINDNYEAFLKQKIDKSLDRSDAAFKTIFNIEDDEDFKEELTKYSLDSLTSFSNTYQSVLEVLIKQGVTDENSKFYTVELYETVYLPYYNRKGFIEDEMVVREGQVNDAKADVDEANENRVAIQKLLNLQSFLGDRLYKIFMLYVREDTYSNSNYISDGLDNAEIIAKARELLDVAEAEISKACEVQYTLSGDLGNFLNTVEFSNIKGKFEIGDWIVCRADERLYKLRLTQVEYSYDSPKNINVTFSNAKRGQDYASDLNDILAQASSMASNFTYVEHQAEQGENASTTVKSFVEYGLDSAIYNIRSGSDQDVSIDEHGITAKGYDDMTNDYSPEQLIITNNILAFTTDNWRTASLGLGKHEYIRYDSTRDAYIEEEGYGLTAGFVQAGHIYGTEIIAGNLYSTNYSYINGTGTRICLYDGTFSMAGGDLAFDGTTLSYTGDLIMTGGNLIVKDANDNILFKADIDNNLVNIGGFTATATALYNGTNSNTSTIEGVYLGTDGIRNYKDTDHYVDIKNGILTANSVNVSGTITADVLTANTSGSIGGFTIENTALYNGTDSTTSTIEGVYIGTDGIRNYKDATHYVDIKNGVLTANNVNVSGTVTASTLTANTGGSIGGFTITDHSLYSGTNSLTSNTNGVYIGTDGIRSVGRDSSDKLRYVNIDIGNVTTYGTVSFTSDDGVTTIYTSKSVYAGGILKSQNLDLENECRLSYGQLAYYLGFDTDHKSAEYTKEHIIYYNYLSNPSIRDKGALMSVDGLWFYGGNNYLERTWRTGVDKNNIYVRNMNGFSETTKTILSSNQLGFYNAGTRVSYFAYNGMICNGQGVFNDTLYAKSNLQVTGNLTVSGTKNRIVNTKDYGEKLLYSYETSSPMFGDVGNGTVSDDGTVFIWLDKEFSETINADSYEVFLQKYGDGDIYITEKNKSYFIVKGTPNLKFGWEIKAKQLDYENSRLENNYFLDVNLKGKDYGSEGAAHIEGINEERKKQDDISN